MAVTSALFVVLAPLFRREVEGKAARQEAVLSLSEAGRRIDAEADVTFFPTSDGGRRAPARSGYLCAVVYDGRPWLADLWFPDGGVATPRETVRARLRFDGPHSHEGFGVGTAFDVREGRRVVGRGRVTRVPALG